MKKIIFVYIIEIKVYFLKKMQWNENKLDDYLSQKEISHSFYDSEKELWNTLENIYKKIKKFKKLI